MEWSTPLFSSRDNSEVPARFQELPGLTEFSVTTTLQESFLLCPLLSPSLPSRFIYQKLSPINFLSSPLHSVSRGWNLRHLHTWDHNLRIHHSVSSIPFPGLEINYFRGLGTLLYFFLHLPLASVLSYQFYSYFCLIIIMKVKQGRNWVS